MNENNCFEVEAPAASEFKKVCVWLAKAAYNDHSFRYVVENCIGQMLHQAGCYEENVRIEALLEGGEKAWCNRTDEENLTIVMKVIELLEDMCDD